MWYIPQYTIAAAAKSTRVIAIFAHNLFIALSFFIYYGLKKENYYSFEFFTINLTVSQK